MKFYYFFEYEGGFNLFKGGVVSRFFCLFIGFFGIFSLEFILGFWCFLFSGFIFLFISFGFLFFTFVIELFFFIELKIL